MEEWSTSSSSPAFSSRSRLSAQLSDVTLSPESRYKRKIEPKTPQEYQFWEELSHSKLDKSMSTKEIYKEVQRVLDKYPNQGGRFTTLSNRYLELKGVNESVLDHMRTVRRRKSTRSSYEKLRDAVKEQGELMNTTGIGEVRSLQYQAFEQKLLRNGLDMDSMTPEAFHSRLLKVGRVEPYTSSELGAKLRNLMNMKNVPEEWRKGYQDLRAKHWSDNSNGMKANRVIVRPEGKEREESTETHRSVDTPRKSSRRLFPEGDGSGSMKTHTSQREQGEQTPDYWKGPKVTRPRSIRLPVTEYSEAGSSAYFDSPSSPEDVSSTYRSRW
ncbi:hypothetical protein CBS101457_002790 [Exobasidium rhododendri]|nr:hypothetical protein CBS101457_002790 [Exobasidium rhododendri]